MNSSHHAENHIFDEVQIDRAAELAREFDREGSELFAVLFGSRSGQRHGESLPHLPGSGTGCVNPSLAFRAPVGDKISARIEGRQMHSETMPVLPGPMRPASCALAQIVVHRRRELPK
jgi:hypothetical protein